MNTYKPKYEKESTWFDNFYAYWIKEIVPNDTCFPDKKTIYLSLSLVSKEDAEQKADEIISLLSQPKVEDKEVSAEEILGKWLEKYMLSMHDLSHGLKVIPHILVSAMHEYGNKLLEAYTNKVQVSDAVEFAEWAQKNYYEIDDDGLWYKWIPMNEPENKRYTSKELYKQSKDKQ